MENTTKETILTQAGKLFAKNGFSGTSIREISRLSNVNVSAVNYHFKSKENLFHFVIKNYYDSISLKINKLSEREKTLEEFSVDVFRLFIQESDMILCNFKMYLSEEITSENKYLLTDQETFGPPGMDSFIKITKNNYPFLPEGQIFFICRNIFSIICHSAISYVSPILNPKLKKHPLFNKKAMEENIIRLTKTLVSNLENQSQTQ